MTRVVRSYHGAVQARTADLLAGVVFGREAAGTDFAEAGFGHIPGTLLELTLPAGPFPIRPRTQWGSQSALGVAPRLSWLSYAFDSRRGLADADRAGLAYQVRSIQTDRQADGLIVTIPLHEAGHTEIDDGWRGAMYQLLEFASSIARSCTVVVAFPDAEPHMLDPCVALFNEGLAIVSGEDTHDPILVLGRRANRSGAAARCRCARSSTCCPKARAPLTSARQSAAGSGRGVSQPDFGDVARQ